MRERPPGHPPTRPFKPRRRALSPQPQPVYDRLAASSLIDVDGPLLRLDELFGHAAPKLLEIGIGAGETTIAMAIAQPELDVVAVDVHTPGIATVLAAIERY